MPSKQKIKGSTWERDVAKHLSDLYSETFIRVPHSGSYIGGVNKARKEFLHEGQIRSFKGDIIPGQSMPLLNIECKAYKDFPFHHLFGQDVKLLDDWIAQLLEPADEGDFNILIMKFNRKGKYIAVEDRHTTLKFNRHINYKGWNFCEYDNFWAHNTDQVKLLSSTQN
jgi:Holliday junction resolvase